MLGARAQDECQQALDIYRSLADHSERSAFLKDFETNGGGKTPGSLKFALTYTKELKNTKKSEVSAVENWITRHHLVKHVYEHPCLSVL